MPLYAFHLDVPAAPEVVAERIRGVIGKTPTFWEQLTTWKRPQPSGRPFIGSLKGFRFSIRRDIQYRNSFLPLIHGRITPAPAGSRVNIFMFMHPFTFIFMAAWLGFPLYAQWKILTGSSPRSLIPLAMTVAGLGLMLGGFFSEALKVKPWLSDAALNSAITAAPAATTETQLQGMAGPRAESSRGRLVFGVAAALAVAGMLVLFNAYERRLRSSPAFRASVGLTDSAAAKKVLGQPIKVGSWVRGLVHDDATSGYAMFSIPVSGPAGHGTLYTVANRGAHGWDVERAILHADTGPEAPLSVDISPPTQRDKFSYPAPGRVYLLPLDAGAAQIVKDIPAYLKSRLDLEVTLLPIQRLSPANVNSKTKQVIAESVLDSFEQAQGEVAGDPDAVILGVTSQDMTIQTSGWDFATNYRRTRFGVLSTARFRAMPFYAGANPEVFAVRVRKMVLKNLLLMHYPLELSSNVTSALAASQFSAADVDQMGENLDGEWAGQPSFGTTAPCVTITQGPGGKQSWRLGCAENPPLDHRYETFVTYPGVPLFVMARTEFSLDGLRSWPFVRKYRPQDDASRAFGIGATDSFDILPVGDSQTFSIIELILADGGRIHYQRTSPGESFADAKLSAGSYMGSPFSLSSLAWNDHGWDLNTIDGSTYIFPSSGPDRTWQQSALTGIRSPSGQLTTVQRTATGDLEKIIAPHGWINITHGASRRISSATDNSGRTVRYEYDAAGRLVHLQDSADGDEFYEYDPVNRLTGVFDAQHRPMLTNTYGYLGEIRSQTLADGGKVLYESGFDESHKLTYLQLTLPNGYTIRWILTRNGFTRTWPQPPAAPPPSTDTTLRH